MAQTQLQTPTPTLGVIGDLVEDIVIYADSDFTFAADTPSRIVRRQGGSGANVAKAAARLVKTRFIGCVGQDSLGEILAQNLKKSKVEPKLQINPNQPTGTIAVLVDKNGERHMFPDRGANAYLKPLDAEYLTGIAALHVTAYSLVYGETAKSVLQAVHTAKNADIIISLDVSSSSLIKSFGVQKFLDLLDNLAPDLIFANSDEAAVLGWCTNESNQIKRQVRQSTGLVLVKRGEKPVLVQGLNGSWHISIGKIDTPIKDTTGAGDSFAAGVLAYLLSKKMTGADLANIEQQAACELVQFGHNQVEYVLSSRFTPT